MPRLVVHGAMLSALLVTSLGVPAVANASEDLPSPALTPGVLTSPRDSVLHPTAGKWGDDTTAETKKSKAATGSWAAKRDLGSMWNITLSTGAQAVWGKTDPLNKSRKITGAGVGVALIDTGVSPVEGLETPGKIVNGPDLSFESQTVNTRYLDGYGHGTHMAGIIAGKDGVSGPGDSEDNTFSGMAPDATLVNMKVGAADGAADVSQVIAAIDWAVQHRAEKNIRVLNLSYGTSSTQSSIVDPLAHAVENAWRAGIVVVVAAGNDGDNMMRPLTMPAVDPFVIAVGSSDHLGSGSPKDRVVGNWTNDGTIGRKPDLLAPGKSVASLRVPGSLADTANPSARVGDRDNRLFRGTGTSQSTAVVSGAVALLLQRNPQLTPDQVKGLLRASADKLDMKNADLTEGAGFLDVKGAVELLEKSSPAAYKQIWSPSTGTGSLDQARGKSFVADPDNGSVLRGEQDIFGVVWDPKTWAPASAQYRSWQGGSWRGSIWAGAEWSGSSWAAVNWTHRSWSGVDWSHRSWSSMAFLHRSWSGNDWSHRSWSADNFCHRSWSAGDWVLSSEW